MTDYFKARERDILFRRIEELTPDMLSKDQRVTGHQLICHLNQSLREYCGIAQPQQRGTMFHRTLFKWLVFHLMPWPERAPRDASAMSRFVGDAPPQTFEQDHAEFVRLLQEFESRAKTDSLAPHPVYGRMSRQEWGEYLFLHIDYHLTAFDIHGDFRGSNKPDPATSAQGPAHASK
jgi:hypothetical protein